MSKSSGRRFSAWLWLCMGIPVCLASARQATDTIPEADRRRLLGMLDDVAREIRENYYDPALRGRDIGSMTATARQRIEAARSDGEGLAAIAQYTLEFDDSHTFFVPPFQNVKVDYGWDVGIVGERGMILEVDADSDAQRQGVHPGDLVESINGMAVTRDTLWKIQYLFEVLRPQPGLHVELLTPQADRRELDLAAKVKSRSKVLALNGEGAGDGWARIQDQADEHWRDFPMLIVKAAPGTVVVKFHEFDVYDNDPARIISAALKGDNLILDLRGNGGGSVVALEKLVGGMFAKDTLVATENMRRKSEPMTASGMAAALSPATWWSSSMRNRPPLRKYSREPCS